MKTRLVILWLILAVVVIYFTLLSGCQKSKNMQIPFVCFEQACINVELAIDQPMRTKGLMGRSDLAENRGMLFVFDSLGRHSFWMKNTLINLDMIWMDARRKVIHIEEDVPPCRQRNCPVYIPEEEALYVLEVNAGWSDKHDLKKGQFAQFYINNP